MQIHSSCAIQSNLSELLYIADRHRLLSLRFRQLVKHIPNNNPILKIITLCSKLTRI
jgi:hypothetical protein